MVDDLRRDLALEAQCLAGRMFGSASRAANLPSVTVAIAPHRETHSAQKQGMYSLSRSAMGPLIPVLRSNT